MSELDEALRGRRSIRRYEDREVTDALVTEILDTCRHAPSSMNGQPWCFVVVRNPDAKARLAALKNQHCAADKHAYSADFLVAAPVVTVIAVNTDRSHDRGRENGILAAAYLLLAAHARGLGGVYLSAYQHDGTGLRDGIARLLDLPDDIEPVCLVPLGFPAESLPPKPLRPLADMIHYERFDPDVPRRD